MILLNILILKIFKDHQHLTSFRTEWMVWDKELQFEIYCMSFQREDGTIDIYDWKRCKEIKKTNGWESEQRMYQLLPNSNFWHYSSLNTYKAILEKNYDVKVEFVFVCFTSNNKMVIILNLNVQI